MSVARFPRTIESMPGSSGMSCGDTTLRTATGSRTIADIVERLHHGLPTRIVCLDPSGTPTEGEIHFARRVGDDIAVVEVALDTGRVLHCTAAQLVLDDGGEWRSVESLRPGDELACARTVDGPPSSCCVTHVTKSPPRAVYEFTVRGAHNVVTDTGLVIHD